MTAAMMRVVAHQLPLQLLLRMFGKWPVQKGHFAKI
jgi:hypothetical protein